MLCRILWVCFCWFCSCGVRIIVVCTQWQIGDQLLCAQDCTWSANMSKDLGGPIQRFDWHKICDACTGFSIQNPHQKCAHARKFVPTNLQTSLFLDFSDVRAPRLVQLLMLRSSIGYFHSFTVHPCPFFPGTFTSSMPTASSPSMTLSRMSWCRQSL